jgi:hypothetical protein
MRQGARIWLSLGIFAVLAVIAFILLTYDILQGPSGSMMLGVFALSMLYIAWVLWHGRYTDPTDQPDAEAEVGPEHIFPPSWAPPLLALGVALFAVGARFTPVLLAVGGTVIVLTLFTWVVQRVDVVRLRHAEQAAHDTTDDATHSLSAPQQIGSVDD